MTNHYSSDQLARWPWIVSTDTLKPEHLLVSFWQTAEHIAALVNRPLLLNPETVASLERLVGEDSRESDRDDERASQALDDLFLTLDDVAPVGFSFGASEGDGACFGYWLNEDWQNGLETLGLDADDPTGWSELISRLELDGIDSDNIADAYQGRAEGYSEERAGADYAQELAQDTWLPGGPSGLGWNRWPVCCIDWADAWRELQLGDGFRLHDIGGGDWLVFRSI
jgi:hypothetical protein